MKRVIVLDEGPPLSARELIATDNPRVISAIETAVSSVAHAAEIERPPQHPQAKPVMVLSVPKDQSKYAIELRVRQVLPTLSELATAINGSLNTLRILLSRARKKGKPVAKSRGVTFCYVDELAEVEDLG